ncbi:guanylate-binding protein 3-like [Pyrus ussuriensis x Pyrus communis]|uniref:Guanylate-binding protein 3-like n=1 Tax=Pyrus ussuriensis x Pyrus communis TaxID=2448454 RepID=A0A5N5FBE2_9ROSA|nr:guanylate-binding protein 3-like [Pyrus ussuriensis x Pyrus communis]
MGARAKNLDKRRRLLTGITVAVILFLAFAIGSPKADTARLLDKNGKFRRDQEVVSMLQLITHWYPLFLTSFSELQNEWRISSSIYTSPMYKRAMVLECTI